MREIPVRLWLLAALAGILQVLPFPIDAPVPVWRTAFCWIALLPLLYALTHRFSTGVALRPLQGAALGYLCGFVWYLGNCSWIYQTMYLYGGLSRPVAAGILVLFCLYLGLYHALFGAVLSSVNRLRWGRQGALLISPFLWVAVELARARITGLPWDLLGTTQVDNTLLSRLAPYTGVYGLSFVIAAVNALWLIRVEVRERRHTRTVLTLAGVVLVVCYLFALRRLQLPRVDETTATATLVQENLEVGAANIGPQPTMQELLRSFSFLSEYPSASFYGGIPELRGTPFYDVRRMVRGGTGFVPAPAKQVSTDLIVWPEAPAPFEESNPEFRQAMGALARMSNAPVIVGNIGLDRDEKESRGYDMFNSASFVAPDGSFKGRYDKIHLVPFGEYVPFHQLLFFAKNLLNEVGTFDAGSERRVFATGGHRFGTFICYESIFGDEVRQFADEGADVLVNISNDGWYGDTSAPWQHLNMVRMRAIENHRWVLRATNTGITAAIDPFGRVTAAAPRHIRTSLAVRFAYEEDLTLYAKYGDWFAYLCAAVAVVGLGYSLREPVSRMS